MFWPSQWPNNAYLSQALSNVLRTISTIYERGYGDDEAGERKEQGVAVHFLLNAGLPKRASLVLRTTFTLKVSHTLTNHS